MAKAMDNRGLRYFERREGDNSDYKGDSFFCRRYRKICRLYRFDLSPLFFRQMLRPQTLLQGAFAREKVPFRVEMQAKGGDEGRELLKYVKI